MVTISSFEAPSSRVGVIGVPGPPCSASDSASDFPPGLDGGMDPWRSTALLGVSVSLATLSCDEDLLGVLVLFGGVVSPDGGFSPFLESD